MTNLSEHRKQTLSRGIAEFEAAHRRRRRRRSIASVATLSLAVAGAAVMLLLSPGRPALPSYVEVITDDPSLAEELALARACERFERNAGRLVVVECAVQGVR